MSEPKPGIDSTEFKAFLSGFASGIVLILLGHNFADEEMSKAGTYLAVSSVIAYIGGRSFVKIPRK